MQMQYRFAVIYGPPCMKRYESDVHIKTFLTWRRGAVVGVLTYHDVRFDFSFIDKMSYLINFFCFVLYVCLFVCVLVFLLVFASVGLFVCLSFVSLSVCLFVVVLGFLLVCVSVGLFLCFFICFFIGLSVCHSFS